MVPDKIVSFFILFVIPIFSLFIYSRVMRWVFFHTKDFGGWRIAVRIILTPLLLLIVAFPLWFGLSLLMNNLGRQRIEKDYHQAISIRKGVQDFFIGVPSYLKGKN